MLGLLTRKAYSPLTAPDVAKRRTPCPQSRQQKQPAQLTPSLSQETTVEVREGWQCKLREPIRRHHFPTKDLIRHHRPRWLPKVATSAETGRFFHDTYRKPRRVSCTDSTFTIFPRTEGGVSISFIRFLTRSLFRGGFSLAC